jgi:hypothetical protein
MTAIAHFDDHDVVAFARWLEADLASLSERPLWTMSTQDAEDALLSLTRVRGQLDALLMRVLRQAEAVGAGMDTGATSTTNWWSHATRTTRAEAHRMARLAKALEDHDEVAEGLASGDLRTDQARVIADAVDDLPDTVEEWVPAAATRFLVAKAAEHDAKDLRVLGRRVLEAVDPVAADAEEARRLESEEADARAAASFTMVDDGHGTCHGRFTIPSLQGAMLAKELKARVARACRKGRAERTDEDGRLALTRHRMGRAFMDYIEARSAAPAPTAGGVSATVVVTMDLETLLGGITAASLDTGGRISAGEARRIACRAGIIPVVLGGPSVPLDVGRRRRFHTEAQRVAMGVRDGGCTAAGCDAPPAMTEAHHDEVSWGEGGGTSVEKGRLLCPPHHRRIHDPAFQHSLDKHGKVRFTRRT